MGCTVCTEPQCLYKGALYLTFACCLPSIKFGWPNSIFKCKTECYVLATTLLLHCPTHRHLAQSLPDKAEGARHGPNPVTGPNMNKHTEVAKLLLTNGSKVKSRNIRPTDTPLHYAAINGDIEIVQMLLNRGANINDANQCGITALHNAVKSKTMEIIELLLLHCYVCTH